MEFFKKVFRKKATSQQGLDITSAVLDDCLSQAAELQLSGQHQAALIKCDQALALNPNAYIAYHIRALANYALDNRERAIEDWKRYDSLRKRSR